MTAFHNMLLGSICRLIDCVVVVVEMSVSCIGFFLDGRNGGCVGRSRGGCCRIGLPVQIDEVCSHSVGDIVEQGKYLERDIPEKFR